jgi:RHS repeat-associated protein
LRCLRAERFMFSVRYTYGLQGPISMSQLINGQWVTSFFIYDGEGNIRMLTDANGNVTDTYDYDAYGNVINRTGNTPNNRLYHGEEWDPDLGMYYLRSRYYQPETGRFFTMDSYEGDNNDPASIHKYLYANANPINNFDPTGRFALAFASSAAIASTISNMAVFRLFQLGDVLDPILRGQQADQAFDDARQILSRNNACRNFFDFSGNSKFPTRMPPLVSGTGLRAIEIFPRPFKLLPFIDPSGLPDVQTGIAASYDKSNIINGLYAEMKSVTINLNGGFYTSVLSSSQGGLLKVPNYGSYPPNNRRVRVLQMLHEVGHIIYLGKFNGNPEFLLPPDKGNPTLSNQNTLRVEQYCKPEIDALPND